MAGSQGLVTRGGGGDVGGGDRSGVGDCIEEFWNDHSRCGDCYRDDIPGWTATLLLAGSSILIRVFSGLLDVSVLHRVVLSRAT